MANLIETARKIKIKGQPAVRGILKPGVVESVRIPEALGIIVFSAAVAVAARGVERFLRDMGNAQREIARANL